MWKGSEGGGREGPVCGWGWDGEESGEERGWAGRWEGGVENADGASMLL